MDRVIFLGCFLLLAVGVLTGLGIQSTSGVAKSIRDGFEILSFIGTAVTAVVALIALTSWQIQFRHSEKWKAVKAFQESLDGGMSAHSHLMYLFTMVARNQAANWTDKQTELTEEFMQKQKAWMEYCFRVDTAWNQIELLYEEGRLRDVENHRSIEDGVRETSTMLLEIYLRMEPTDLFQLHQVVEQSAAIASERSRHLFLQAGNMLKALVR